MGLSGFTHIAQLWLFDLDGPAIIGAGAGVIYLLIALGLAGHSRFTLWASMFFPGLSGSAAVLRYLTLGEEPLTLFHVTIDSLVILFCAYILFRTRYADMD